MKKLKLNHLPATVRQTLIGGCRLLLPVFSVVALSTLSGCKSKEKPQLAEDVEEDTPTLNTEDSLYANYTTLDLQLHEVHGMVYEIEHLIMDEREACFDAFPVTSAKFDKEGHVVYKVYAPASTTVKGNRIYLAVTDPVITPAGPHSTLPL